MSIQPLPPEVIAQIKSSVAITSLNDVVCELIKNALDAQSSKIRIKLNYSQGSCNVEDDGHGILPTEFHDGGGLGKPYHTSKSAICSHHGFRGSFIASLAATALTTITSHHRDFQSTNSITMHQSNVVARQVPSSQTLHLNTTQGTKVVVHNLFGNMPVRVKHRANQSKSQSGHAKEWENLRQSIVSLVLAWPSPLDLSLRNEETLEKLSLQPENASRKLSSTKQGIHITRIHRVLSQAAMFPRDQRSSWVRVNASAGAIAIDGAVSLAPSPTNSSQFISIGIRPFETASTLHEVVNSLFAASSFGSEEDGADDEMAAMKEFSQHELKVGKKGVDRYPQFYLRLVIKVTSSVSLSEDVSDFTNTGMMANIIEMLRVMFFAFLEKYHFRPRKQRQAPGSTNMDEGDCRNTAKYSKISKSSTTPSSIPSQASQDPGLRASRNPSIYRPVSISSSLAPILSQDMFLTRMKSGVRSKNVTESSRSSSFLERPMSAPPNSAQRGSAKGDQDLPSRFLSSIDKKGRLPFDDVEMLQLQKRGGRVNESVALNHDRSSVTTSSSLEKANEQVWINPITKVKSIINTNTGHNMPVAIRHAYLDAPQQSQFRQIYTPKQHSMESTSSLKSHPSKWLSNALKSWNNPIYSPTEQEIPRVCFDGAGQSSKKVLTDHSHVCSSVDISCLFKEASDSVGGRISKDALRRSKVIAQIDKKYILVRVDHEYSNDSILVIIDQHAADERVRFESLLESFFASSANAGFVETELLTPSLNFDLSSVEMTLLAKHQEYFARWGIMYKRASNATSNNKITTQSDSTSSSANRLVVTRLPSLIHERCKQEPRILIDLIRTELWKVEQQNRSTSRSTEVQCSTDWLHMLHTCPQGIIDMLNSRACRSAIMFNDTLSISQCETLVVRLAACKFPFQCAHGRPSLIPLVDIGSLAMGSLEVDKQEREQNFGGTFEAWKKQIIR